MGLATQESYSKFFVCQWTPFCAAIIAYLRLQKRDNFSLLPSVVFGLIVLNIDHWKHAKTAKKLIQ